MEKPQIKINEHYFIAFNRFLEMIIDIINELKSDESNNKFNFNNPHEIISYYLKLPSTVNFCLGLCCYDSCFDILYDIFYKDDAVDFLIEKDLDEILLSISEDTSELDALKIYLKSIKRFVKIINISITNENKKELINELEDFLKDTIDELLTYDLSDTYHNSICIIDLYSCISNFCLEELDLSKTKSSFNLGVLILRLRYKEKIKVDCNGCKVKFDPYFFKSSYAGSLDDITIFEINEKLFDEETRRNNPKIFLSNIFSKEFKDKFYNRTLNIEDILTLDEDQLEELNQNQFLKYIYRPNGKHNLFQLLIKNVDIKTIKELYNNYHDDYIYLETILRHNKLGSYIETFIGFYNLFDKYSNYTKKQTELWLKKVGLNISIDEKELLFLKGIQAKDIKKVINDNLRAVILFPSYLLTDYFKYYIYREDSISRQYGEISQKRTDGNPFTIAKNLSYCQSLESKRSFKQFALKDLPTEFVEENKDIFLVDSNILDDVKQRYFERNLTLQDIISYPNYFLTTYIWNFTNSNVSYLVRLICEKYALRELTQYQYLIYIESLNKFEPSALNSLNIQTYNDLIDIIWNKKQVPMTRKLIPS